MVTEDPGFSAQGALKQGAGLPAVMYSAKTVPALDGKPVRLGGYPVPLESDEQGRQMPFFLVPIRAPASTCRRHRRIRSCWCATRVAFSSTRSTRRCGSTAR
ncbi:hypothetical protein SSTU70S_02888 [Stutzerimonas stutzeri]